MAADVKTNELLRDEIVRLEALLAERDVAIDRLTADVNALAAIVDEKRAAHPSMFEEGPEAPQRRHLSVVPSVAAGSETLDGCCLAAPAAGLSETCGGCCEGDVDGTPRRLDCPGADR